MNAEHQHIIKINRGMLQEKINFKRLIDYLKEYKMFNKYMWEDLNCMSDLLDLLPTRGPNAFYNFIEILRKSNYNIEADILENHISTSEEELCFKMSSVPLGYCLIINNVDSLECKEASNIDANSLHDFFKKIGYFVTPEENMKAGEMISCFQEFCEKDFSKVDSLVVIIFTHCNQLNSKRFICGSDGSYVAKKVIFDFFSNKEIRGLINKPKIFFFISYIDEKRDYCKLVTPDVKGNSNASLFISRENVDSSTTLPSQSDVFALHVTFFDHNGTFFCKELISALNEYYKVHDLETIIESVTSKVSEKYSIGFEVKTDNIASKKKILLCNKC